MGNSCIANSSYPYTLQSIHTSPARHELLDDFLLLKFLQLRPSQTCNQKCKQISLFFRLHKEISSDSTQARKNHLRIEYFYQLLLVFIVYQFMNENFAGFIRTHIEFCEHEFQHGCRDKS